MDATADSTGRYTQHYSGYRGAFYRTAMGLEVSTLGSGSYLGATDDAADQAYVQSIVAACERGINIFDPVAPFIADEYHFRYGRRYQQL
jgi:hypothetical protein